MLLMAWEGVRVVMFVGVYVVLFFAKGFGSRKEKDIHHCFLLYWFFLGFFFDCGLPREVGWMSGICPCPWVLAAVRCLYSL